MTGEICHAISTAFCTIWCSSESSCTRGNFKSSLSRQIDAPRLVGFEVASVQHVKKLENLNQSGEFSSKTLHHDDTIAQKLGHDVITGLKLVNLRQHQSRMKCCIPACWAHFCRKLWAASHQEHRIHSPQNKAEASWRVRLLGTTLGRKFV